MTAVTHLLESLLQYTCLMTMFRRPIHKKVDLATNVEPLATIHYQLITINTCAVWSWEPELAGMAHKVASDSTRNLTKVCGIENYLRSQRLTNMIQRSETALSPFIKNVGRFRRLRSQMAYSRVPRELFELSDNNLGEGRTTLITPRIKPSRKKFSKMILA